MIEQAQSPAEETGVLLVKLLALHGASLSIEHEAASCSVVLVYSSEAVFGGRLCMRAPTLVDGVRVLDNLLAGIGTLMADTNAELVQCFAAQANQPVMAHGQAQPVH